jgi:hypothetical protein
MEEVKDSVDSIAVLLFIVSVMLILTYIRLGSIPRELREANRKSRNR